MMNDCRTYYLLKCSTPTPFHFQLKEIGIALFFSCGIQVNLKFGSLTAAIRKMSSSNKPSNFGLSRVFVPLYLEKIFLMFSWISTQLLLVTRLGCYPLDCQDMFYELMTRLLFLLFDNLFVFSLFIYLGRHRRF